MNRHRLVVLTILLLLGFSFAIAQLRPRGGMMHFREQSGMRGNVGLTVIDGEAFYLVNLMPELVFGELGIGLDINLRFNREGKLRIEDFDETYDYFRMLRYVRWGMKHDPVYARLGVLDYSRLGHGFIMYYYRNNASYDGRKLGAEFDVDFGTFGFESVYSDFGGGGILGLRGYARPLQYTDLAAVPILGGFEVGATYATDMHPDADKTKGDPNATIITAGDGGTMTVMGIDIGFPLLSLNALRTTLYADYANIVDYDDGVAVGIDLDIAGGSAIGLGMKYERRWLGDQFIPSYFDPLYERERFRSIAGTRFVSKTEALRLSTATEGYYGELYARFLGSIYLLGAYYSPVGVKNRGALHLELDMMDVIPEIILIGGYDKKNVGRVFVADEHSLLSAEVGYRPYRWLIISTLYEWTFAPEKVDGKIVGYKSQKRVEPRIGFVLTF